MWTLGGKVNVELIKGIGWCKLCRHTKQYKNGAKHQTKNNLQRPCWYFQLKTTTTTTVKQQHMNNTTHIRFYNKYVCMYTTNSLYKPLVILYTNSNKIPQYEWATSIIVCYCNLHSGLYALLQTYCGFEWRKCPNADKHTLNSAPPWIRHNVHTQAYNVYDNFLLLFPDMGWSECLYDF